MDKLAESVEAGTARRRELESRLGELATERLARDEAYRTAADEVAAQQAVRARAERERDWYAETATRLEREISVLESTIRAGRDVLEKRQPAESELAEAMAAARARLDAVELTAAREESSRAGADASAAAQLLAGRQAMLDAARKDLTEASERLAAEQTRGEALAGEVKALEEAAVRGSTLGGILGFFIGAKGGRPLLQRFFKPETIALVQNQYRR